RSSDLLDALQVTLAAAAGDEVQDLLALALGRRAAVGRRRGNATIRLLAAALGGALGSSAALVRVIERLRVLLLVGRDAERVPEDVLQPVGLRLHHGLVACVHALAD